MNSGPMLQPPAFVVGLFRQESSDGGMFEHRMQDLWQDQLHTSSYTLFEKDPVKYVQYEKVIRQALKDRHGSDETVILMVLGAGRGPLADAALRASSIKTKVWYEWSVKDPTNIHNYGGRSSCIGLY